MNCILFLELYFVLFREWIMDKAKDIVVDIMQVPCSSVFGWSMCLNSRVFCQVAKHTCFIAACSFSRHNLCYNFKELFYVKVTPSQETTI